MKTFAIGLLSAAALTTTNLLVRQQREAKQEAPELVPAGESRPASISLERIREAGL